MFDDENKRRDRRFREEISDEQIRTWYQRYYQYGMSLRSIGRRVGVNERYLSKRFKALGLPVTRRVHEREME